MDGVQSAAKFADAGGDFVTKLRSEMRKTALDPIGDTLALPVNGRGSEGYRRRQEGSAGIRLLGSDCKREEFEVQRIRRSRRLAAS